MNPIPSLIIGIVVSFGVGFMVGAFTGRDEVITPANWDPSGPALKSCQDTSRTCHQLLERYVLAKAQDSGISTQDKNQEGAH